MDYLNKYQNLPNLIPVDNSVFENLTPQIIVRNKNFYSELQYNRKNQEQTRNSTEQKTRPISFSLLPKNVKKKSIHFFHSPLTESIKKSHEIFTSDSNKFMKTSNVKNPKIIRISCNKNFKNSTKTKNLENSLTNGNGRTFSANNIRNKNSKNESFLYNNFSFKETIPANFNSIEDNNKLKIYQNISNSLKKIQSSKKDKINNLRESNTNVLKNSLFSDNAKPVIITKNYESDALEDFKIFNPSYKSFRDFRTNEKDLNVSYYFSDLDKLKNSHNYISTQNDQLNYNYQKNQNPNLEKLNQKILKNQSRNFINNENFNPKRLAQNNKYPERNINKLSLESFSNSDFIKNPDFFKQKQKSSFEENYNIFFKNKENENLNDSYLESYLKQKNDEKIQFLDKYIDRRTSFYPNTEKVRYPKKMEMKLNNCFDDINTLNYFKRITPMKYNIEIQNIVEKVIRRSEESLKNILDVYEFD